MYSYMECISSFHETIWENDEGLKLEYHNNKNSNVAKVNKRVRGTEYKISNRTLADDIWNNNEQRME